MRSTAARRSAAPTERSELSPHPTLTSESDRLTDALSAVSSLQPSGQVGHFNPRQIRSASVSAAEVEQLRAGVLRLRRLVEDTKHQLIALLDAFDEHDEDLEPADDDEPSLGWPEQGGGVRYDAPHLDEREEYDQREPDADEEEDARELPIVDRVADRAPPSRRTLLAALAAAPAAMLAASIGAGAAEGAPSQCDVRDGADGPLLAMLDQAFALGATIDAVLSDPDSPNDADEAPYAALKPLEERIIATPALTPAGLRGKAALVAWCRGGALRDEHDEFAVDGRLMLSIVRDLQASEAGLATSAAA